ncbi:fructosamine kinase, partial [Streptomyces sp. NPDC006265]
MTPRAEVVARHTGRAVRNERPLSEAVAEVALDDGRVVVAKRS